jgi:hypothetical protein
MVDEKQPKSSFLTADGVFYSPQIETEDTHADIE